MKKSNERSESYQFSHHRNCGGSQQYMLESASLRIHGILVKLQFLYKRPGYIVLTLNATMTGFEGRDEDWYWVLNWTNIGTLQ